MHFTVRDSSNGYRTKFLFTSQSGELLDRHNVRRALARYYKRIGVEDKSPHCYRRTFASHLAKNGVPIHQTAKLLGHEKIDVCLKYYVGIDDEQKRDAISRLMKVSNL